jgi:hypothetical protein
MKKCYDTNLRFRLPANNGGNDIVLNGFFKDWNSHIASNLSDRECEDMDYESGKDRELLELCKEHAMKHQKTSSSEEVIMLTHPFYTHLSHMDCIKSKDVRRECKKYLDNLLGFLNLNQTKNKIGVVALETIHHYAAATSLLLEMGLINRVVFTEYDLGHPLNKNELRDFKKKEVFFGGGYNGRCLKNSIMDLRGYVNPQKIWAIKELVLNPPDENEHTLIPSEVTGIETKRIISLEDALFKLDMIQKVQQVA